MTAPGGFKVRLKAVRITGARTQSPDQLQALVADAVGKELDFARLAGPAAPLPPPGETRGRGVETALQEGPRETPPVWVAGGIPAPAVQARTRHLREGEPL